MFERTSTNEVGCNMKLMWLLGNGFDLNLGLRTSYRDFYTNYYAALKDEESVYYRMKIEEIEKKKNVQPGLWCDLEAFVGIAASDFETFEEFNDAFVHLQTAMKDYLGMQEAAFDSFLEEVDRQKKSSLFNEFNDSIVRFPQRLDVVDRVSIERCLGAEAWRGSIHLVTLNYTNCVDVFFEFAERVFTRVLHPHGKLGGLNQINFGVADQQQIHNPYLAKDQNCIDCWTKEGRNIQFGNMQLERLYKELEETNLIIAFGVAFGQTDLHIWKKIGQEMRKRSDVVLLQFSHSLPDKGDNLFAHNMIKEKIKKDLLRTLALPDIKCNRDRIVLCNSSRVFRFMLDKA